MVLFTALPGQRPHGNRGTLLAIKPYVLADRLSVFRVLTVGSCRLLSQLECIESTFSQHCLTPAELLLYCQLVPHLRPLFSYVQEVKEMFSMPDLNHYVRAKWWRLYDDVRLCRWHFSDIQWLRWHLTMFSAEDNIWWCLVMKITFNNVQWWRWHLNINFNDIQ